MAAGMAGCGEDQTTQAEQSLSTYFSATSTGEWAAAAAASTGLAQTRALFYQYASTITGLPSGTLFSIDATQTVTASIDELVETDGVLRATGTIEGGRDLSEVEFLETEDGIKVSDYLTNGMPLADLWSQGDSTDSGGGLVLTSVAGRLARTGGNVIGGYQWISVIQNENSWPVSVDAITFTPDGASPVTWVKGQAPSPSGSTIAAQQEVAPGRSASVWVRQDATGTTQGGGNLTVTLSGAGVSRELTVELPTMSPPPGYQTAQ